MDELIVTCVQQQIRIFESHDEFRSDIQRFMRLAKVKESHLVIFPELSGLLLVPPLAPGLKRTLLKMAERQIKKSPSVFDRMIGRAADSAAGAIGGISRDLADTILGHEGALRDAYLATFSEIAREYGMYILGGSIYLPDTIDGQMHNMAFLFDPAGDVIGQQSKIALNAMDRQFCQPAINGLKIFTTDFGKLGILIGEDVLYPESGRILAENGTTVIANLLAAASHSTFLKTRHAFTARLQENLLLGAQSCLVGKNILGQNEPDFIGRSTLFAPIEMTSRYSGTLGEVGSMVSESIVSATWDIKGLLELRQTTSTPTHIIPDDNTLRSQIRKVYGPSEDVRLPTIPLSVPPMRGTEEGDLGQSESDMLPLAEQFPLEQEWEELVAASEEIPEEGDISVAETVTAPESEEQTEALLASGGEEGSHGELPVSWPMPELFFEEEEPIPLSAGGPRGEEWQASIEVEETEEPPVFATLALDEFEEPPDMKPEAERQKAAGTPALPAEQDYGWSSKLWDDDSAPSVPPEGRSLAGNSTAQEEPTLESEENASKKEAGERKSPFSRLRSWWNR